MSWMAEFGGCQLWILIQLQIHVWVVLFDLNLQCTLNLTPVPLMSHLSSLCVWVNSRSGSRLQIHIWVVLFDLNFHCVDIYVNPLLSSKFNILSNNYHSKWSDLKHYFTNGVVSSRWSFWVQQPCVILKIEHILSNISVYPQYYLLYVYISHIFYFSSVILVALNDNLELSVFM